MTRWNVCVRVQKMFAISALLLFIYVRRWFILSCASSLFVCALIAHSSAKFCYVEINSSDSSLVMQLREHSQCADSLKIITRCQNKSQSKVTGRVANWPDQTPNQIDRKNAINFYGFYICDGCKLQCVETKGQIGIERSKKKFSSKTEENQTNQRIHMVFFLVPFGTMWFRLAFFGF